jgi:hypothetical protein
MGRPRRRLAENLRADTAERGGTGSEYREMFLEIRKAERGDCWTTCSPASTGPPFCLPQPRYQRLLDLSGQPIELLKAPSAAADMALARAIRLETVDVAASPDYALIPAAIWP